ncbi:MAG TPA: ATP-binding protein, partial [Ktedonobacteraceae bacterium]|nr:ATP-binding protein [Ktedonobacteraceae bacterium]
DEVFEVFWESGLAIVRLARESYLRDAVRTTPRTPTRVPKGQSEFIENYFVYTIVPTHDASGKVSGVIIYAVDETAQRAQEAEEEREKLRLIFENTGTALALYDAQAAELLMASPRYLDIVARAHGFERGKLIGRKWHELTFAASVEEAASLWDTALESRAQVRRPEVHLRSAQDEQETIWDWSLTPILDIASKDTVRFMLVSAIEITEQTLARQEMEQLNRLKDEFMSLAGHELRTPLSSILGNAQLLQRGLKRQVKVAGDGAGGDGTAKPGLEQEVQMLERIIHQVNRMDKLIGEMMDITGMRAELFRLENRQHINIVDLVRRVVEQCTLPTDHALNLQAGAQELLVTCDEARVEQVLDNLLSNAIKYSPADKPVVVGVEGRPGKEPKEAVVWVRDEGPGINEEEQGHIFDRFYRASLSQKSNVEGLGLGLYIAHEIISLQGGRMWLESKPGAGSTFYFSLPLE